MSASRIVLWRHGQTDFNINGQVQGQVDIPLNAAGLEQAQKAAKAISKADPVAIYSSDLGRAKQTAQALADIIDVDVIVDERLRERAFGVFEGLTAKEMSRDYGDYFEEWRKTGECSEAGIESRVSVGSRVAKALREYAKEAEGGSTIVVTSHGSSITQGIVSLLGLDPLNWQGMRGIDNCHWSVLIPHNRAPFWRIAAHNLGAGFTGFEPVLKRAINQ